MALQAIRLFLQRISSSAINRYLNTNRNGTSIWGKSGLYFHCSHRVARAMSRRQMPCSSRDRRSAWDGAECPRVANPAAAGYRLGVWENLVTSTARNDHAQVVLARPGCRRGGRRRLLHSPTRQERTAQRRPERVGLGEHPANQERGAI